MKEIISKIYIGSARKCHKVVPAPINTISHISTAHYATEHGEKAQNITGLLLKKKVGEKLLSTEKIVKMVGSYAHSPAQPHLQIYNKHVQNKIKPVPIPIENNHSC